jgi:hypothetical protein
MIRLLCPLDTKLLEAVPLTSAPYIQTPGLSAREIPAELTCHRILQCPP